MTSIGRLLLLQLLAVLACLQGVLADSCIQERFCFNAYLPSSSKSNNQQNVVRFKITTPRDVGWFGLGVGKNMVNSYLMVLWPNDDGGATVSVRRATDYRAPDLYGNQNALTVVSSGFNGSTFHAEIQRPVTVDDSTVDTNGEQLFAVAFGNTRPNSNSKNADIRFHGNNVGHMSFRVTTDESGNSNGSSGSAKEGTDSSRPWTRRDKLLLLHAVFMLLGWTIATPAAIFIARFCRKCLNSTWFRLHWGIQVLVTTSLVIVGTVMAYLALEGFVFTEAHHRLGIGLVVALIVQIIIGVVHHALFDRNRGYTPWWTKLHWWFGRLMFILALVQIELGFRMFPRIGKTFKIAYYVYIGVLLFVFLFLSFRVVQYRRRKGKRIGYSDERAAYKKEAVATEEGPF